MRTGYEIRSGKRTVALKYAATPREALIEYLRGIGCRDDEITTMGMRAISWRGAVFTAIAAADVAT
jgi:hypothetical protein